MPNPPYGATFTYHVRQRCCRPTRGSCSNITDRGTAGAAASNLGKTPGLQRVDVEPDGDPCRHQQPLVARPGVRRPAAQGAAGGGGAGEAAGAAGGQAGLAGGRRCRASEAVAVAAAAGRQPPTPGRYRA